MSGDEGIKRLLMLVFFVLIGLVAANLILLGIYLYMKKKMENRTRRYPQQVEMQ